VIKQVLVTTFGFTKTGFVLVLQGSSQNLSTKTFCFGFFLSHEPKLLPKLASPIRDENSQNIAYRYKTYIRRNQKKRKKVLVGCKERHKANTCSLPKLFTLFFIAKWPKIAFL